MTCANCGTQLPPDAAFCGKCGAPVQQAAATAAPPASAAVSAAPPADLPQHAMERLGELRSRSGKKGLFTSDLSVNEFLLVRRAGFDPVGLVVGSSIYHIGYQQ